MKPEAVWQPPSAAVAELIRTAVARLLDDPAELFDAVDAATLGEADDLIMLDADLAATVRAANRANLAHWALSNMREPGCRVAPNVGPETLDVARQIVRRGLVDPALVWYRTGQNVAWRHWMDGAFQMTSDPALLREFLSVSARSIFTFVDETLSGITAEMERERVELARDSGAERLEVVNLVLQGAPITAARAGERLRYEFARRHTAAILWGEPAGADQAQLAVAADALATAVGAGRPFVVAPGSGTLWVWLATDVDPPADDLRTALAAQPGVRAALGPTAHGIEGFRRSHQNARATQRLLVQIGPEPRVAGYDEVQLVALTTGDPERAAEFVAATLGELAGAPADLRETVRVYLREGCSATRAARVLFTHRNTVLNRLARATDLLPQRLEGRVVAVAMALEIVHWLGAPAGGGSLAGARRGDSAPSRG